jgi:hypothetical protein
MSLSQTLLTQPTQPPLRLLDLMERLSAAIGHAGAGELAELFIADGRQALAGIDRAQKELDLAALRSLLADLRGISAMISAHRLARACGEPLAHDATVVAAQVAGVQEEWNRTEWLLSTWMRVHDLRPTWLPGQRLARA